MYKKSAVFLLLVLLIWAVPAYSVAAQQPAWQPAKMIYQTENLIDQPLMLSDRSGRLHLFWQERELEPESSKKVLDRAPVGTSTLYYMVKEGETWSEPVDILTQSNSFLGGVVDPFGRIHLILYEPTFPVRYIRSRDSNALSAQAWTKPIVLSEGPVTAAGVALDPAGTLHVVYGTEEGSLKRVSSTDWGETWSVSSATVPSLPVSQTTLKQIPLTADVQGALHMLWTLVQLPDGYPPLAVEYASSADGGFTWSVPEEVAPADQQGVSIVSDGDGRISLLLIGRAGVGGRYHLWSEDGGANWSRPLTISSPEEGSGLSGGDLAVDSANTVHVVFGLDAAKPEADTLVAYSFWKGGAWSPRADISAGVPGHMERMSIEVTEGNRLHAIWPSWTFDRSTLWYAEGLTESPAVPVQSFAPLSAEAATPEVQPTVENTPLPSLTPPATTVLQNLPQDADRPMPSRALPVFLGAVLSAGVISVAVVRQMMVRSRR